MSVIFVLTIIIRSNSRSAFYLVQLFYRNTIKTKTDISYIIYKIHAFKFARMRSAYILYLASWIVNKTHFINQIGRSWSISNIIEHCGWAYVWNKIYFRLTVFGVLCSVLSGEWCSGFVIYTINMYSFYFQGFFTR